MNFYSFFMRFFTIFLGFSIPFSASLKDIQERKLDKILALAVSINTPSNPDNLDMKDYVVKLEKEVAQGGILAAFHLGNIYISPALYGLPLSPDLNKAGNYLIKVFKDMEVGGNMLLQDSLALYLQNPTLALKLRHTGRQMIFCAQSIVNVLKPLYPELIRRLQKSEELLRSKQKANEQMAWDNIMLEVYETTNLPMRLEHLPPKREGSWYTNAEHHKAASILQDSNTPPVGVSLVEWQIHKLEEVFGCCRAITLHFSMCNLELFMSEGDLSEMLAIENRIHPRDRASFLEHVQEVKKYLKEKAEEKQDNGGLVTIANKVIILFFPSICICVAFHYFAKLFILMIA